MEAKDIIEAILKFLGALTAWPVILLFLSLYFRREIRDSIPDLAKRLTKAPGGFEFSAEIKALQDAIETGADKLKDKPEQLVDFIREQVKKLPKPAATSKKNSLSLSGASILWVDDKPMNNVYEASLFKSLGAKINFVQSTTEAKEFLSNRSYDIIISDIHRVEDGRSNPDAGYELLDYIKHQRIPIPVIFYTGSVTGVDPIRSSSAFGVADAPNDLKELVINALENSH